jgi:hypothetical protein
MSKTKVAIRRAIHYRWEKREERIKPHLYRMDGVRETPTTIRRVDVMALANGLIPIPIKSHAIRTHTHNKRAGNSSLLFFLLGCGFSTALMESSKWFREEEKGRPF